jgi:hypothetical protein
VIEQLKTFIKRNKADNLHIKSGWHERLQAIYVYHYQLQQKSSVLDSKPARRNHASEK